MNKTVQKILTFIIVVFVAISVKLFIDHQKRQEGIGAIKEFQRKIDNGEKIEYDILK